MPCRSQKLTGIKKKRIFCTMTDSIIRRCTANPESLFNHKSRLLDKMKNLKKLEEVHFLNTNCGGKLKFFSFIL